MMKKISVLHITFELTIGGAQQVIRQLIENMDGSKVHSEIVCIDNIIGELGETMQSQGIEIHVFNRQHGFDMTLIKGLYRLIASKKYDVIHCHQYTPYLYGLLASVTTSAKVIFTEHGRFYPDYGTWKRKMLNPLFSLFTNKITAISKATKDALVTYENFSAGDIDVVYNGIKDYSSYEVDAKSLKKQFNIPNDTFLFGTISRLQPIKNQIMMINAFHQLATEDRKVHLLVVGDGEIKKDLEALVKKLSLTTKVTFTGFQTDPYRFHHIIDVFLLSSFSEGTSMTLLEAMSLSKPSVVTNVGGNPELISNEVNGYVVPSDDQEAFYLACEKLFLNVKNRKAMGENARKKFLELFSAKSMVEQYMSLYGVKN